MCWDDQRLSDREQREAFHDLSDVSGAADTAPQATRRVDTSSIFPRTSPMPRPLSRPFLPPPRPLLR